MKCPNCFSENHVVTDSRDRMRGYVRKRACLNCGYKFFTVEKVVEGSERDESIFRSRRENRKKRNGDSRR